MDKFEQKYGIQEDDKVKDYHRSRRMFCIYQNRLYIADKNLPYSHTTWFEKEAWLSKENDELINKIVRGVIDSQGNIYFYIGYDFRINSDIEPIFLSHLRELVQQLNLDINAHVFGGVVKSKPGEIFPPIKDYGKIKDNLK